MTLTRREILQLSALGIGALALPAPLRAWAESQPIARHGLSAFGDLKYGPDFTQFDYVRADAPKGGRLALTPSSYLYNQDPTTFNTLNSFVLKGQAAVGRERTFDSLMARAYDEPDSYYGLAAKSITLLEEGRIARFEIRKEARFHDGSPLTAEDAAFSLTLLKAQGHPLIVASLAKLASATVEEEELVVTISGDYPLATLVALIELPIFSKAYWADKDFSASTLDAPLGSGPYKVKDYRIGISITYERVKDYWAKDLPVNKGQHNFDELRFDFFRDRDTAFTAFTANEYDLREEFTSRVWATRYDFPAVKDGRVKLETLPDASPAGGQAWHINSRKTKFSDPREREAIAMVFDFEWSNTNLFYGLYSRTHSLFENSPMKAVGAPEEAELALLEPLRADLPDSVFETAYLPPETDGSGRNRALLRKASSLLQEAGFLSQDGKRMTADGEPFEIEFLMADSGFLRIVEPYIRNLEQLGIIARARQVDSSQYQLRLQSFDFDLVTLRTTFPLYPSPSLNSFFHSTSADVEGSRNLAGVKSPAVDQLLLEMQRAKTRNEFLVAARALDRVLRSKHYYIFQWYKAAHHLAYWDRFARPETKPLYQSGVVETWWQRPDISG